MNFLGRMVVLTVLAWFLTFAPIVIATWYTPKPLPQIVYSYNATGDDWYTGLIYDKWESEGNFGRPWP